MGLIKLGRVIKSYIAKVSGSGKLAQWLAVEEFAGDERKAQVFGACNEDFAPPNDTSTIDVPLGIDRGFLTSVAYRNQKITPVAIAGERRLYSTNEAGDTVMSEVYFRQDGTLEIQGVDDNFVRWIPFNLAMQLFIASYNNHVHGGGLVPDIQVSMDLDPAKTPRVKTEGVI